MDSMDLDHDMDIDVDLVPDEPIVPDPDPVCLPRPRFPHTVLIVAYHRAVARRARSTTTLMPVAPPRSTSRAWMS